jgi:hypothetical protein
LVEVEFDRLRVGGFDLHRRAIAEHAVMRHGQLVVLVVIHRDHFVGRADEATLFQHGAAGQQAILNGHVNRALTHVALAGPRTDEGFHALEFR